MTVSGGWIGCGRGPRANSAHDAVRDAAAFRQADGPIPTEGADRRPALGAVTQNRARAERRPVWAGEGWLCSCGAWRRHRTPHGLQSLRSPSLKGRRIAALAASTVDARDAAGSAYHVVRRTIRRWAPGPRRPSAGATGSNARSAWAPPRGSGWRSTWCSSAASRSSCSRRPIGGESAHIERFRREARAVAQLQHPTSSPCSIPASTTGCRSSCSNTSMGETLKERNPPVGG